METKDKVVIEHLFKMLGEIKDERYHYVRDVLQGIIDEQNHESKMMRNHPFWGDFQEGFDYE